MTEVNALLILYALYDVALGVFLAPFEMATEAAAVRLCRTMVGDPRSMAGQHPADFRLYRIGAMVRDSGELVPDVALICSLDSLVPRPEGLRPLRVQLAPSGSELPESGQSVSPDSNGHVGHGQQMDLVVEADR